MQHITNIFNVLYGVISGISNALRVIRGTHKNHSLLVVLTNLRYHLFSEGLDGRPRGNRTIATILIQGFIVQLVKNLSVVPFLVNVFRNIGKEASRSISLLVCTMGMVVYDDINAILHGPINHVFGSCNALFRNGRSDHGGTPAITTCRSQGLYNILVIERFVAPLVPKHAHTAYLHDIIFFIDNVTVVIK